jgi:hypothetical protein
MNREVTFLASYRMARQNGESAQDAVAKASDVTWRTHFDYQNSSRPRLMQSDTARVLLVFRNFSINMLWRLFRDTHQAISGGTPAERREARKQLIGITASMMLHAGVTGTWLYGLTMTLMALFFPGDDDDLEEEFKRVVVETLGTNLGGALLYGTLGHVTGIDITTRIGMPDLWFRSPDRPLEGEDAYNYWLSEVVGAVPGIAESMLRGAEKIGEGDYIRGIEGMVPKAARDILRTYRYYTEGATTTKGDPLVDELPTLDLVKQALGFTPAVIAERYAANGRLYTQQAKILDARTALLRDAAQMVMVGTPLDQAIRDRLAEFNAANPDYPITGRTIARSVDARQQARDRAEFGATLNPRLNDRLRAERAPLVYSANP